ncbi:MAG: hypothetical protein PVG25_07750 [Anaerolineae bacterium]|jgi:hypothetical protein
MGGTDRLATVKVQIDPDALKTVIEQGRLTKFLDVFPALVAGQIKAQIVEQMVAEGSFEFGEFGFLIDDFGNDPPRPRPWADVGVPASTLVRYQY